jgi:hypothetical protein
LGSQLLPPIDSPLVSDHPFPVCSAYTVPASGPQPLIPREMPETYKYSTGFPPIALLSSNQSSPWSTLSSPLSSSHLFSTPLYSSLPSSSSSPSSATPQPLHVLDTTHQYPPCYSPSRPHGPTTHSPLSIEQPSLLSIPLSIQRRLTQLCLSHPTHTPIHHHIHSLPSCSSTLPKDLTSLLDPAGK